MTDGESLLGRALAPRPDGGFEVEFRTWAGARTGAGRKPKGRRAGVTHAARPKLDARHPVLVTWKLGSGLPSLRSTRAMASLRRASARGHDRLGLRLVHYAVQASHIHLVVEVDPEATVARSGHHAEPLADGSRALSRGLLGQCIRIARGIDRAIGRSGRLFADRYHGRVLTSPRAVRHALAYLLLQRRRHGMQKRIDGTSSLDPCSSGRCSTAGADADGCGPGPGTARWWAPGAGPSPRAGGVTGSSIR